MKRTVAFCFLSAAFAHGALAAIPESAEGWYTPSEFEVTKSYGTVMYQDDYGVEYVVNIMIDEDANFIEVGGSGASRLDVLSEASMNALQALVKATRNTERIKTIGKNLHDLTQKTGIEVTNENTGQMFTIKFNGSIASASAGSNSGVIPATSDADDPVDKKTLNWTDNTETAKLQLYNAKTATGSTEGWWDDYGFVVPYLKGNNNLGWKKFGGIDSSVLDSVDSTIEDGARLLTLYGWYRTSGNCTAPLSEMLTKDDATQRGNRQNHFLLAQYTAGQTPQLHYVPIGDLMPGGGAPVDGVSVTTNEADGATAAGVASLHGWESAVANDIPQKGDGKLKWTAPGGMVDGTSIATTERGEGVVWEVKDAHSYAGAQARHYFGTGDDSALGWHELPNVTTNNVVGDEKTISSTFDQTGETKIFGLKGFPTSGTLLALACQGGDLLYIPFPAGGGTNLVAVDDVSVSSNTTGRLQLHGWETQGACSEKAAEILAGGEATAQSKHEIVTRYGGAGGSIHYLPFDVFPHPNTDDFTIDANTKAFTIKGEEGKYLCGTAQGGVEWKPTNGVDRASIVLAENVAALNGFAGADPGMMPFKDDGGKLAWREQAPVAVDRVSVVTNQDREITLNGFDIASDNAVPFKSNGVLAWGSVAAITNRIVAGAGINVTDNGEGTLTISAKALDTNGGTATYQTLTVVTSVQYNPSTHKFQCKTRQITFLGSAQAESGWTDVFEATSHKGEHQ